MCVCTSFRLSVCLYGFPQLFCTGISWKCQKNILTPTKEVITNTHFVPRLARTELPSSDKKCGP